jgi:uncharacterized protein (UPF0332 family)
MKDVREFLTLAQDLLKMATEAAWRSAVSRAYYAAFHIARQLLRDLNFTVPRADRAHAYLWMRLSNCSDPQVQLAGRELNDLRRERNQADYDVDHPWAHAAAAGKVRDAGWVIQTLDAARSEPLRTQITDAMKIYERDVLKDVTWHP